MPLFSPFLFFYFLFFSKNVYCLTESRSDLLSRICCAPLTQTRRCFLPNRRLQFLKPPLTPPTNRDTGGSFTPCNSTHHPQLPPRVNVPRRSDLILRSVGTGVSQRNCPSICPPPLNAQGGAVFPSFTYLTAAVLSFVVFPFYAFPVDFRISTKPWTMR